MDIQQLRQGLHAITPYIKWQIKQQQSITPAWAQCMLRMLWKGEEAFSDLIALDDIVISVTEDNVRRCFMRVNPRKASGFDTVLKICADQLTGWSFCRLRSEVPSCFERASIIPSPKKSSIICLNDYRSMALISIMMKCSEKFAYGTYQHLP